MKSLTIFPHSHLSCFQPTPCTRIRSSAQPFKPWKDRGNSDASVSLSKDAFVAGFGEASPEKKAANNLHNFFTYVAVRIVTAQLESYNTEAHEELMEFLERNSLNDGDEFCATLMRESPRHTTLAMQILEVRSAYCKNDFEWDNLQRLSSKIVEESNTRLMRDYVLETSHESEQ